MAVTITTTAMTTFSTPSSNSNPNSQSPTSISCGAKLYDIPTTDAACAVPASTNPDYSSFMTHCCGSASPISYYDNCGLYCLAEGQKVGQLVDCLTGAGVGWSDVFCNTNMSAVATGTETESGSTATKTGDGGFSFASSSSSSPAKSGAGRLRSPAPAMKKMIVGIMMIAACSFGSGVFI